MIELINVNKHFRLKKDGFSVLNNINVTFKKGKFYAVMDRLEVENLLYCN